jgi:hypothetical protein
MNRTYYILTGLLLLFSLTVSGSLQGGTYDKAYFGAKWLSSVAEVRKVVRGDIDIDKGRLSPWDVPHVRALGHLYFLEDRDFAKLTGIQNIKGGGDIRSEYYFFRDQLSIVKIFFNYEDASFQGLLSSLETDYGKAVKDASKGVDGTYVQHIFDLPELIIEVSYHPYKVPNGYACKELVCRMVNKKYIGQIEALHDKLREKYSTDDE